MMEAFSAPVVVARNTAAQKKRASEAMLEQKKTSSFMVGKAPVAKAVKGRPVVRAKRNSVMLFRKVNHMLPSHQEKAMEQAMPHGKYKLSKGMKTRLGLGAIYE